MELAATLIVAGGSKGDKKMIMGCDHPRQR
jgi:hypothetical protein